MEEKRNDEIDLIEVAQKTAKLAGKATTQLGQLIYKMLYYIIVGASASFRFLVRNSIIIIVFAVAGYLIGTLWINIAKPYYKTNATIQSNTIQNASLIDYINRIHNLAENRDSISLAEQLNIPVEKAAEIRNLQAFWMIDKNKDGIADEVDYENQFTPDTITNSVRITSKFFVQLLTYDPTIIRDVQTGLESYIDTYPRLMQIAEVKKQNLETEIARIRSEIEVLDSLRRYEYFLKEKELREYNQNVIRLNELLLKTGMEEEKPTRLLHQDIIALTNQNLNNVSELELNTEPYIFLSKFVQVNNPVNIEKESGARKKITALFILLAIILSLLFKNRKEFIAYIKGK